MQVMIKYNTVMIYDNKLTAYFELLNVIKKKN